MKKIITLLGVLAMLIINGLGSAGKLGISMADLNGIFPFLFMPPVIAFVVSWSLIFLLQFYYIFLIFSQKEFISHREFGLNIALILANISWMIATTQGYFLLSVGIIVTMYILLSLLARDFVKNNDNKKSIIFGIYLGWITIATFVIAFGQVLYIWNSDFAMMTTTGYLAILLGILMHIITYFFTKNSIAFFWGGLVLFLVTIKFFQIFFVG